MQQLIIALITGNKVEALRLFRLVYDPQPMY